MTEAEIILALSEIKEGADQEEAHGKADDLLLEYVPETVKEAYEAACSRVGGFWYA